MKQTTGKGYKLKPKHKPKPKYTKRQLEDAIIQLYEHTTRFNVNPILVDETARQVEDENIDEDILISINAVLDYHQVHQQFRESFNIVHPEVKITPKTITMECEGVPVHIRLIDNNRSKNEKYRNPVIKWFLTTEVYIPNK